MGLGELIKSIGSESILVVIAGVYIWKSIFIDPKQMEKVTKVIENNTDAIRETKTMHKDMDKTLQEIKENITELKQSTDLTTVYTMLERLEDKLEDLGK